MIPFGEFKNLPTTEIARLVNDAGPQVCVFPVNGTRRWFLLECQNDEDYLQLTGRKNIEILQKVFEHGVNTIIAPVFGSELLTRGAEYTKIAVEGLSWLGLNEDFLNFYKECDVRVHFYGDFRRKLEGTPYSHLSEIFDTVSRQTSNNKTHRLFFGVFADSALDTVAQYSVNYYVEQGEIPNERQIIKMYYGEEIGPVDIYIGFDKFYIFDIPLLSTENTDLYFTINPSLYLNNDQLRAILYDHLYARTALEPNYDEFTLDEKERMAAFYRENSNNVFGVGF